MLCVTGVAWETFSGDETLQTCACELISANLCELLSGRKRLCDGGDGVS